MWLGEVRRHVSGSLTRVRYIGVDPLPGPTTFAFDGRSKRDPHYLHVSGDAGCVRPP